MRASISLSCSASSAISVPPAAGTVSRRPGSRIESSSASSIIERTGVSAAPARNQPPSETSPAKIGRPTTSASTSRWNARSLSARRVPTASTTSRSPTCAGPTRSRARSPPGATDRTSVERTFKPCVISLASSTCESASARGDAARTLPRPSSTWAKPSPRGSDDVTSFTSSRGGTAASARCTAKYRSCKPSSMMSVCSDRNCTSTTAPNRPASTTVLMPKSRVRRPWSVGGLRSRSASGSRRLAPSRSSPVRRDGRPSRAGSARTRRPRWTSRRTRSPRRSR